ncbi:MAG: copper chaperone PCu(A)C [Hyphomonas sp.]|uniref:copper chaperone PCu(A)C n=1 Tax=Hyphomonas sp. TaxID=87 RepID=UPI0035293935
MLTRLLVPAAAALALAACSPPAIEPAAPEAGTVIEVTDAYVMMPLEGRDVTGGGLKVTVQGAPVDLIGATTDAADRVELHTMTMDEGVMQMRQVESFTASEDAPIVLQRGGNHLMLFGLDPSLAAGDTVDIALEFRDADGDSQTVVTSAEVKGLGD